MDYQAYQYITLHETSNGLVIQHKDQNQLIFSFNNVSLTLSPTQFFQFKTYVEELVHKEERSIPQIASYQISFQPFPITLKFNWRELCELCELLDGAWVAWELTYLMKGSNITTSASF